MTNETGPVLGAPQTDPRLDVDAPLLLDPSQAGAEQDGADQDGAEQDGAEQTGAEGEPRDPESAESVAEGAPLPRHRRPDRRDDPDEPRGTRFDARVAALLSTPARRRLWAWGGPALVLILAAVLRFWNLGHPQTLVFDETYYVKDAWSLLHLGYEAQWPDEPNPAFESGDVDSFLTAGSYVVHPPLGKWLIALGMALGGADDAFWWRATTALAGVLLVAVVMLCGRRLFRSTALAVIAGLLLAVDGHAIVLSRVALLDTWLALFIAIGFWFVLLDRESNERALERRLLRLDAAGRDPALGPAIWNRPWVLAAGAAFGAACAVKWSGLYALAAFGVYLIVVDALARRRAGVALWGTGAILKQGPVTFLLLVPVAFVVYLSSWTGWLVTQGGYYRQWATEAGNAATGLWSWVPLPLQSLWHYHQSAYGYHVGVDSSHPYQAAPWTFLFMIRPTNMYFHEQDPAQCGASQCWESIMAIGNPLIWWAAAAAVFYLVYRLARYREWQVGALLVGVVATWGPWLLYPNRTVFEFYMIVLQPFTVLALTWVIRLLVGSPDDPTWRRQRGLATAGVFLVAVLVVAVFFYPLYSAIAVSPTFRQLHFWLPTWA
ncbi:dolichyl-phosphate-mannose--protein mannosyltransferase [Agromyces seonyuensis]|uniref:Polyprenol-phosphate-mannose--protein mannosyltransferase n=1 Tax=Agromyces seonyuensis TaxID=2662446 RepID=A0A6I4P427_9MICO|nr:phospholipid carrier-dependent glycosyltransferase [Agromyces seonyuensis]MWB98999.1 phospholipid carrier-dependent glycosyltransferase [Agromyces seonyuensis]